MLLAALFVCSQWQRRSVSGDAAVCRIERVCADPVAAAADTGKEKRAKHSSTIAADAVASTAGDAGGPHGVVEEERHAAVPATVQGTGVWDGNEGAVAHCAVSTNVESKCCAPAGYAVLVCLSCHGLEWALHVLVSMAC